MSVEDQWKLLAMTTDKGILQGDFVADLVKSVWHYCDKDWLFLVLVLVKPCMAFLRKWEAH